MFDLFDTADIEIICPECWACAEANAEPPYGLDQIIEEYRDELRGCNDLEARDSLEQAIQRYLAAHHAL